MKVTTLPTKVVNSKPKYTVVRDIPLGQVFLGRLGSTDTLLLFVRTKVFLGLGHNKYLTILQSLNDSAPFGGTAGGHHWSDDGIEIYDYQPVDLEITPVVSA